jgi:Protein of unknown function (DUF1549)/Protein of unknown function (DUF1553)
MRSRRRRPGACGILVRVVVAGWAAIVAGGPGARAGDGAEDATRLLVETIDRLIAAGWAEHRVEPAAPADDAEFLRRVSLDLAGRIPSAGEAHEFLEDPSPEKRRRLVDRLLAGPAYVAHFTTIERRLMIPEADTNRQLRLVAPAFEAWLRRQVAGNVGYDQVVRELLTVPVVPDRSGQPTVVVPGFGPVQEPSPLPFYLAKEVKGENLAASTARLFLGLRLECAQCHNHPFATWTREQFWGYAAFFSGLESQGPPAAVALAGTIREVPNRHEATVPGTSKVVQAAFLDGALPAWRPEVATRAILAEWMVSPENPFFARAAVNRVWAHLFGVGLVDPVDDMGADNPPSHPELLDALARSFVDHGFDRKLVIRAIVLSRPYQLSSAGPRADEAVPVLDASEDLATSRLFARMAVRGLSGEQLYASLAQAVGLVAEEAPIGRVAPVANTPRAAFLERFAGQEERPAEAQTSILQALALMNGGLVSGATSLEEGATLSAIAEVPYLDPPGRVEELFLATLSRRPTPEESARLVNYLERGGPARDRRKALSDVFWALLNSPEFHLNH